MQFIFFVPPNEELEGTLHPRKFGCTPKNEGKRVHVPPDEKTCGHTDPIFLIFSYLKAELIRVYFNIFIEFFSNFNLQAYMI